MTATVYPGPPADHTRTTEPLARRHDMTEPSARPNHTPSTPWWRAIGPALITACVVFGPGSLLISSNVGANYGYELLWLLILTGVLMGAYMTMAARIGVVGGASPCTLVCAAIESARGRSSRHHPVPDLLGLPVLQQPGRDRRGRHARRRQDIRRPAADDGQGQEPHQHRRAARIQHRHRRPCLQPETGVPGRWSAS